jgi:hypothetical protein
MAKNYESRSRICNRARKRSMRARLARKSYEFDEASGRLKRGLPNGSLRRL